MMKKVCYLLLVGVAFGCLDSRENKLQRFLIQGNDMATKRSYREAKRYYNEALKMDSCFVDAWNNLGTVYYKEGHFPEALDAYTNALQCDPRMRQALLNRSNTFYELSKYKEALADIDAFSSLGSDTLVTHLSRGLIFTRMNDLDRAITSFKRALEFNSIHAETLVNLATVFYYQKNYDSAKLYLREALQSDPQEANAHNVYALLELDLGNENAALLHANHALSLKKDDPYFLNNRGWIFIKMNKLEDALKDIDKSIGEDPYNAWAYRNKGVYYLKMNEPESALRLLTRAEQMDTTVSQLYYFLGEANFRNGNKQTGCSYFRKSLRKGEISQAELKSKCGK